jgi:hypothetical protein
MVKNCANSWCSATRLGHEGKLYRLDIELGNKAGGDEHKTEYVWLCSACARKMHPEVEVAEDTIKLRLKRNEPMHVVETESPLRRAN